MNILERITAEKRAEVAARKKHWTPSVFPETPPDFVQALRAAPIGLIAEIKRRSPSAGIIRKPFNPVEISRSYEIHGASAISCLVDKKYFGGKDEDFTAVRHAVKIPVLYKEFVVDPWQVAHARQMGASAVLLIAGILTDAELTALMKEAKTMELQPLIEVHNRKEMRRAADAGADCIGINNRDLKTFSTTLETTFELAPEAPADCTLISESGIKTPEDAVRVKRAGAHAVLVGESLLRAPDPGAAAVRLLCSI